MKTEMLHKVHVKEEVGLEFKFKNTKNIIPKIPDTQCLVFFIYIMTLQKYGFFLSKTIVKAVDKTYKLSMEDEC